MKYSIVKGKLIWKSKLIELDKNLEEKVNGIKIHLEDGFEFLEIIGTDYMANELLNYKESEIYLIVKQSSCDPCIKALKIVDSEIYNQFNCLLQDCASGKTEIIYGIKNKSLLKQDNSIER